MNRATGKGSDDPYSTLQAFDRLEVGPVRLQARRIVAPYTIIGKDRRDTLNLTFRYEEDVFVPGDPDSVNLAALIAAQPALNYGLFCSEIVFHGAFDQADRSFLKDMAQNTAREILVKKFLEPNPFLKGAAKSLKPIKADSYLRARLVFPESRKSDRPGSNEQTGSTDWKVDPARYAVLSSGGKDSLLTFGLLKETGMETHPVFINESGRHWYTAINAYRHYRQTYAETARIWTDVDRIFTWVLRRMPFIRTDFQKLRTDEYPIRLWTVAILIFSALPIAKKRGIGRIVVGDEYDTTQMLHHDGIPHYDGLYDQSRHFDNALTRFYRKKGWSLSQFSILRPLSELLIEKILVERYPELQQHQVSCHAAHSEGERFLPCGRCEKCRRIVGMLVALGADPSRCGYTGDQIKDCLTMLEDREIHQEKEGARHLAFILKKAGIIPPDSIAARNAREHPEVMKMRFDAARSPINAVPSDLRKSTYRIFMEHAQGALKRKGRVWIEVNPLSGPFVTAPYPFGSATVRSKHARGMRMTEKKDYILAELTWPEAKTRFKEVDVALLPVGSVEQHGPHLPLDTDAFDADYLAKTVASRCSLPRPLVLPLVSYGVSYHHEDFPGTFPVSPDTLYRLVYDIGMAAARNGVTKLVIINGHGGNVPALNFAAQLINRDAHIFTCVESGETSDPDVTDLAETANDVHAGEIETSTSLAIRPDLVSMKQAAAFVPKFSSRYLNFSTKRSVEWYARTARISKSGILGDPTRATGEKGHRMWDVMIRNLLEFIEDLKRMTLDEIHQRRY